MQRAIARNALQISSLMIWRIARKRIRGVPNLRGREDDILVIEIQRLWHVWFEHFPELKSDAIGPANLQQEIFGAVCQDPFEVGPPVASRTGQDVAVVQHVAWIVEAASVA